MACAMSDKGSIGAHGRCGHAMLPYEVRHEIDSKNDDGGFGRGRAGRRYCCGRRPGIGTGGRGEQRDLRSISAARIRTCTPTVSVPIIGRYLPIKRARASAVPQSRSGLLQRGKSHGGLLIAASSKAEWKACPRTLLRRAMSAPGEKETFERWRGGGCRP